jgi:pyridoxal phosphate-dependent aminotransferase EpsN
MNILLTCAGRRSYLVRFFRKALGGRGHVVACDSSACAPALVEADRRFVVPAMDHPDYFEALVEICRDERVRLLFSPNDLELGGLARHTPRFLEAGTLPVVSAPAVLDICQDKWATCQFLERCQLASPKSYLTLADARSALERRTIRFPLLVKPRWGTSSIGVEIALNARELALAHEWGQIEVQRSILAKMSLADPERCLLIQEYVEGEEYGMDVVNDLTGRYACTLARRKLVMRAGNTDRAVSVAEPRLERIGRSIGQQLGHIGPLDCDLIATDKDCFVLDLNPRLGGGYVFSHLAGADLPAALIAWASGAEADPGWLSSQPGVMSAKYDDTIIVDRKTVVPNKAPQARSIMKRIYLSPPHLSGAELELVKEAFASNWIAPLGPHVDAFEQEFAKLLGVPHAAALSSGTAAIHLALRLLKVGPGDTVVCPTMTFCATANPIIYEGAAPIFIDCEPATWNMDPELLREELRQRARRGRLPKGVISVDVYGQCADYDRIAAACAEYEVPLIEDAAEALGATYRGKMAGTFGRCGVFSFNGNKIITTSGGGMLVSEDAALVEKARFLATQARDPAPHYQHSAIGYNYRMSNILAAVGRGQLRILGDRVSERRRIFAYYRAALAEIPGIRFMPQAPFGEPNCWLTCITAHPDEGAPSRHELLDALAASNIEARPLWKPLHLQPVFAGCACRGGTVAADLFEHGLCLPSGSAMTDEDLERVVAVVKNVVNVRPSDLGGIRRAVQRMTPPCYRGHTVLLSPQSSLADSVALIKEKTTAIIDELIDTLPDPTRLTSEERRGIIARYASVLEGNFIYWMTATFIAAKTEQARPILLANLHEEVRDCHPLMLRKFAIAANALPTDKDALAVHDDLTKVRQFMGKLAPVKSALTMGFFEGFIQRFMSYLASLAAAQGSAEREYTDVHGVCDIEHTEGLFKAVAAEMALTPPEPDTDLFEGVTLLRALLERIIRPRAELPRNERARNYVRQASQEHGQGRTRA